MMVLNTYKSYNYSVPNTCLNISEAGALALIEIEESYNALMNPIIIAEYGIIHEGVIANIFKKLFELIGKIIEKLAGIFKKSSGSSGGGSSSGGSSKSSSSSSSNPATNKNAFPFKANYREFNNYTADRLEKMITKAQDYQLKIDDYISSLENINSKEDINKFFKDHLKIDNVEKVTSEDMNDFCSGIRLNFRRDIVGDDFAEDDKLADHLTKYMGAHVEVEITADNIKQYHSAVKDDDQATIHFTTYFDKLEDSLKKCKNELKTVQSKYETYELKEISKNFDQYAADHNGEVSTSQINADIAKKAMSKALSSIGTMIKYLYEDVCTISGFFIALIKMHHDMTKNICDEAEKRQKGLSI